MQHGGATSTAVGAGAGPTSFHAPSTNQMLPQVHVTAQVAQVTQTPTSTAQIQEAHSTTTHLVGAATATAAQLQEAEAALEHDKKAIYRHPLFPLMALLFEKCEQATQTPDCPSSDSFDVDIQAFVHHQEQDRKPFFSDDPELDNLMVKAIQVLRIHLLELEKVNDLCKDFITRYISCLKGKLQSENLLRSDMPSLDPCSTPPLGSPTQPSSVQTSPPTMTTLGQGQIVSGGTIYQMVQTPQGLVAQPIQQLQNTNSNSVSGGQSAAVIHGSTPLSQIGVPSAPSSSQNASVSSSPMVLSAVDLSDDEDYLGKKKNKRGVLPKQATQVMKSWLFQHIVHPYPTEDEKRQIAGQTNLSLLQVNNWFINARRRILQPMLDASNPTEAKAKKAKTTNRPVQRFWPDNIASLAPQSRPDAASPHTPTSAPSTPTDLRAPSSGRDTPGSPHGGETGGDTPTHTPSSTPQPILLPPGTIVTPEGQIVNVQTQQVLGHIQGAPPVFHNGDRPGESPGQRVILDTSSDDSGLE